MHSNDTSPQEGLAGALVSLVMEDTWADLDLKGEASFDCGLKSGNIFAFDPTSWIKAEDF